MPPHPSFPGTRFADLATHQQASPAILMNIQGLRTAEGIVCWPWKWIIEPTSAAAHQSNVDDDPDKLGDLVDQESSVAAILAEGRDSEPGSRHSSIAAISPFVFALLRPLPTHIGPEVSSVVWAPREPLITVARSSQLAVTAGGKTVKLPGWRVQGHVVWGLTDQIPTVAPGHVESGRRMIP